MSARDTTFNAQSNAIPPTEGRRERLTIMVLTGLLFASVALNVVLAHRIREFAGAQDAALAERVLKAGTAVPPIMAKRLGSGTEQISYLNSDRPTVLYVFTPQCVWCQRNLANLRSLIKDKGDEYRFVGISLTDGGVEKYITETKLNIPVYTGISAETRRAYKMRSTPETIAVSTEGRVLQAWGGAYVGGQKSQIESFFHVTLPGLQELPKAEVAKN